jgi:uncharacterized repeat protein (TIGR01451 family)
MRWYLGAALGLALAIALGLDLLAYAMYTLLGLLLLSRFLSRAWMESLAAVRECDRAEVEIGETVAVTVTLTNRGRLPIAWFLMEDLLPRQALIQRPPRLVVRGRRIGVGMLRGGGKKVLVYRMQCAMRGYHQIGPLVLETGDLFGLHRRFRDAGEPSFLTVYPKVIPLEGYDLASRRPIGEIRLTHRLYEDPTRIAGVRLYRPGDPLNRVHWPATARTATLHSKVYEPSTIAGATFLLDFHRDSYPARNEPGRSELAVMAVASLANAVDRLGQQVGLVTNGRDGADRIRDHPSRHDHRSRASAYRDVGMRERSGRLRPIQVETRRGPEQLRRILETLARVELTDGLGLGPLLLEVSGRLPRDASLVAILATATDEAAQALGQLRRRGFAVSAVLVAFDAVEQIDHGAHLMAEGIPFRTVGDEAELSALCQDQLSR